MYTLYLYTEDAALAEKYLQASRHQGDAGIDLYCPNQMLLHPFLLGLQIRCRMTKTTESGEERDVSYYLYPRSSLAKTRLRLSNSVGIIDAGYRGEIMAAFDVLPVIRIKGGPMYEPEEISLHQRLVQICSPTLEPIQLVVVDSLEKLNMQTERGSGGFGSTGK